MGNLTSRAQECPAAESFKDCLTASLASPDAIMNAPIGRTTQLQHMKHLSSIISNSPDPDLCAFSAGSFNLEIMSLWSHKSAISAGTITFQHKNCVLR